MSEDRREVVVEVVWVPTDDQPLTTHHWRARTYIDGERVANLRCYTRVTAIQEALTEAAAHGVDVDYEDEDS